MLRATDYKPGANLIYQWATYLQRENRMYLSRFARAVPREPSWWDVISGLAGSIDRTRKGGAPVLHHILAYYQQIAQAQVHIGWSKEENQKHWVCTYGNVCSW